MPDIASRSKLDALKKRLEGIASSNASLPPRLNDAIVNVLTAIDYADETLVKSSFFSFLSCLADLTRDAIHWELKAMRATKECIKEIWQEEIDGLVRENFDELKNIIESVIDERIASMMSTRDKLVKPLQKREHNIGNAQQLEEGIRDFRHFREHILKDWPSLDKKPSPINLTAVAAAREAFARGDRGMRKDQLIWGQNCPSKESEK